MPGTPLFQVTRCLHLSPPSHSSAESLDRLYPPVAPTRPPRKRTTSQCKSEPPLLRTSKRTIYTAGRPPWYNEHGAQSKEAFVIGKHVSGAPLQLGAAWWTTQLVAGTGTATYLGRQPFASLHLLELALFPARCTAPPGTSACTHVCSPVSLGQPAGWNGCSFGSSSSDAEPHGMGGRSAAPQVGRAVVTPRCR